MYSWTEGKLIRELRETWDRTDLLSSFMVCCLNVFSLTSPNKKSSMMNCMKLPGRSLWNLRAPQVLLHSARMDRISPGSSHLTSLFASPSSSSVRSLSSTRVKSAATSQDATSSPSNSAWYQDRNVIEVLRERGLVNDVTSPKLEELAAQKALKVYCGFDPTADSLHLGNLLGIIVLSWFQRCGHQPVALLGGATGRVGDPSGKSSERPILSEATIDGNIRGIGSILQRLLAAGGTPQLVNNLDWFGPMSLLTFLRDIGKYARVGTMMSKDSVRTRMESESGISYTEFTYQLLQGYDFLHLYKEHGVQVQIGGSDQWGNITAGTELTRKILGKDDVPPPPTFAADAQTTPEVFGLTFPLLVDSNGKKFGKSEGGAIWLTAEKLSPYQFYQYLFKTTDADVIKFLKMLTFLSLEEIAAIERSMAQPDYTANDAQRRLAEEVTRFVHGETGLQQALRATEGLRPGAETVLDATTLEALAGDIPTKSFARDAVVGKGVAELLAATALQPSKSAARKLIKGGGVRMNNARVEDELAVVAEADLIEGKMLLLAAGKKNKLLVRVESE